MPAIGKYDTALQMFVLPPAALGKPAQEPHSFAVERGELEHRVEGAPSGPLTDDEPSRPEGAA